ncbi:hypothetical protein LCGC14_0784460 [marine sediment metagenome]|uniref:Uncharacterized protein n=1 Tax=marine sediment metagenome TaxID=412755 RepID=A0A0F9QEB1_9ZZZZ|nr:hypothetical protein [Phycisphaerae bacterium]
MASEREVTQFEKVRVATARRPMHLLTAKLEQWGRQVAPAFINEAWKLVGTLRDAIRVGQYDLGIPFVYQKSAEVGPETSVPLVLNVKKFGVISHMTPFVTNIEGGGGSDVRLNAGVVRIQIGAQTIYEAQNGTLFRPSEVFATGFIPVAGGFGSPADEQGYLRRIPVAQGDVIEVEIRNFSTTDTFQIGLQVTQYGMIPPQALNEE